MSAPRSDLKPTKRHNYIIWILPLAALLVVGCSSGRDQTASSDEEAKPSRSFFGVIADTVTGSLKGAFQAAQTPLEDINIKRQAIPEKLEQVSANPYALPTPVNCASVTGEIASLDTVLGPDFIMVAGGGMNDSLSSTYKNLHNVSWQNKDQYIDHSSSFIQQRAADEVKSHASILPYRHWLRWISGADAHAKKVAQAYEAGKLRRAFLKGVAVNLHCWKVEPVKPLKPLEVKNDQEDDAAEVEEASNGASDSN